MWNLASFEPDRKLTPDLYAGPPPDQAEVAAAPKLVAGLSADLIKVQRALARLERRQTSSTTAAAPPKTKADLHAL